MEKSLPPIPAKRYFTIGEVGELCDVKPHVLRYWEQEFTQLRPVKRRGNRRYYQHHEVLMIRRISDLLYSQGFTISGARNQLQDLLQAQRKGALVEEDELSMDEAAQLSFKHEATLAVTVVVDHPIEAHEMQAAEWGSLRRELFEIRDLLAV
jgi:DNA-binding transcriptional MerR regulator